MINEKGVLEQTVQLKKSQFADSRFIDGIAAVETLIKTAPKVGEWIPVSERLPENCVEVLVWFEYFRYGNYNMLFQTMGISYTYNGEWSGFINGQSGWHQLSIIAWQPLPEPYKGESK